jgi:hypothetical protein
MDPHTRRTLIAKYKDGYRAVADALAGATDAELDAHPAPGKWSALDAFNAARRTTADILERTSESDWTREGTHTEVGRYTMDTWLEIYAAHAHNHAAQIRKARESAKKP